MKDNSITYYPQVTHLDDDPKFQYVVDKFGDFAELLYLRLLRFVYRTEGYYIKWNKDTISSFAKRVMFNTECVDKIIEVVRGMVEVGLFDKDMYAEHGILTSRSIQSTWFNAKKKSHSEYKITEEYWLLEDDKSARSPNAKRTLSEHSPYAPLEERRGEETLVPPRAQDENSEVEITSDGTPITSEDRFNARTAIESWNESFQGTKQEFPETDTLPEMLVHNIRLLRDTDKTPERFREAFRNAKSDNFTWTLWQAVKNQANFDQLIAKSGKNPRARSGPPSCGLDGGSDYGDPSKYSATAFD